MNPHPTSEIFVGNRPMPGLARFALAVILIAPMVNAAPADSKTPSKPFVLFMGADIAVEKDKAMLPVEDVTATALVIRPGGKRMTVPLEGNTNMRINESLKIARASLEVEGLKAERAYATNSDPFDRLVQAYSLRAGEEAVADLARGRAVVASSAAVGAGNSFATANTRESLAEAIAGAAAAQANQQGAETAALQALNSPINQAFDTGAQVNKMGLAEGSFDAIRLSFDVISDKDLAQPYYAFIAQIRDPNSKPGEVRKWACVKSLGTINAGVIRKVNVYRSGLPPGYILESYEVHLYNGAEELATNLSRKRVPITAEEAIEFRIIEYVGANKGRTLPAAPVNAAFAGEVTAALTPAQLSETCYVRVAKDGRVIAAFRDASGTQPFPDPKIVAALKTLQFKPALEVGRPIESIVPLDLGQFASR